MEPINLPDNNFDEPDEYDLISWLCPRCHSDNIREEEEERLFDGISIGYGLIWTCGECCHEFDEPMMV